MTFARCLLACFAALLLTAPVAAASAAPVAQTSASSFTLRTSRGMVARIGAFRTRRDPTIRAAIRVFGRPSSRRRDGNNKICMTQWRRLRLRIVFANFGAAPLRQSVCSDSISLAQSFTARGRRFRTWRGLRVGQRSSMISRRHPSAEFRRHTWWLRTAVSPIGGRDEYPVVDAIVSGGRVRALRGWVGAAG
jgi:hypothetical protein